MSVLDAAGIAAPDDDACEAVPEDEHGHAVLDDASPEADAESDDADEQDLGDVANEGVLVADGDEGKIPGPAPANQTAAPCVHRVRLDEAPAGTRHVDDGVVLIGGGGGNWRRKERGRRRCWPSPALHRGRPSIYTELQMNLKYNSV